MKHEVDGRREIASRNTAWANIIARKPVSYTHLTLPTNSLV